MFLILMMTLFFFLYIILSRLAALPTKAVALLPRTPGRTRADVSLGVLPPVETAFQKPEAFRIGTVTDKVQADDLLLKLRQQAYVKGSVTETVRPPKGKEASIGDGYEVILKNEAKDENLFDRTLKYAKTLNLDAKPEDIANNLYPTMSLIDKSEELIGVVSSASVADLDLQTFEKKYGAFESAYGEYLSHADQADTKNSPEIAIAHNMLEVNRGQLEAGGSVTLINSMLKEFKARLEKIFSELVLEGYAKRHPGMEHQCGVPKGGTLILLHTHRNLIRQVLGDNQEKLNEKLASGYEKLGLKTRFHKVRDPREALAQAAAGSDPLDDFVVLADFCLPYLCCDTDCSDIVLDKPARNISRPGLVAGRIFGIRSGREVRTSVALEKAVVSVTRADTEEPVVVTTVGEAFSFSAPEGIYRIEVKKRGYATTQRLIHLREGGEVFENFVLDRLER
jgi:hypothetical protein